MSIDSILIFGGDLTVGPHMDETIILMNSLYDHFLTSLGVGSLITTTTVVTNDILGHLGLFLKLVSNEDTDGVETKIGVTFPVLQKGMTESFVTGLRGRNDVGPIKKLLKNEHGQR